MNWLCKHGWHKFRARYNEKPSGYDLRSKQASGYDLIKKMRSLTIIEEYVYDICERCGEIRRNKMRR